MGYYDKVKIELQNLIKNFNSAKAVFDSEEAKLEAKKTEVAAYQTMVKQMAKERQMGFPVLAKAYDDLFRLQDQQVIDFLKYKTRSAVQASEVVSQFAKMRRDALREKRIYQYLVDYYESIYPFLADLREEVADITEEDKITAADYSDEELQDEVVHYLSKEEYRKLSVTERNQLALDRYWKKPKSKWHIGKIYERYIGFLFENEGYDVEYVGIIKGFEDLGRDVIARKNAETIIIQCKNWAQWRTIYEKHIFQFFGTVFQYKDTHPGERVRAIFYTTTQLSDLSRRFGKELGIEVKEEFRFDQHYPCIKCNINRATKEKIYHLPFDQQYDKTKITPSSGEAYCPTVKQAEALGFRRAFRWHGEKSNS